MTTTKTPADPESETTSGTITGKKKSAKPSARSARLAEERKVAAYLQENPDFLLRHSDLLEKITTPSRDLGEGVSDFQQFMVDRLKTQVQELRETQQALIAAGQENDDSLGRIHASALRLVEATTLLELGTTIADIVAPLCGVDCAILGLERTDVPNSVVSLPRGMVDLWLGPADAMLHANTQGMVELFGAHAPHVRSFALMRVEARPELSGVVGFGSRDPECFTPDQGTELVAFLTGIIARQINKMIPRAVNMASV